jgi:copper chaperone NosL
MNKMKLPRILILLAGLLMITLFIWPMWKITLLAPQYPDGVEMHIYINKIGGATPGTLQNINILNHYIGMKAINPDSIPELKYMPPIVLFFIITALLIAYFDKKWMYWVWIVSLILILIVGLYDFYLWEYDYGHTLDPKAPMKFDDSFQPPLIGRKEIINFTAISLPHVSGIFLGFSVLLGMAATYFKTRKTQKSAS